MNTDRLPPHSRDAEKGVLGAILRDPIAVEIAFNELTAENFYFDAHQKIWNACAELVKSNKPVDLVTCYETLLAHKNAKDVGGNEYLIELWESVPTAANVEYHAHIVREKSVRRRLLHSATEIIRDAHESGESATDLLLRFYESAMTTSNQAVKGPKTLSSALAEVMHSIDDRSRPGGRRPVSTGFDELDQTLGGGFRPGEFILIGARPSVGKTAFATSILVSAAQSGIASLLFSLEMGAEEIASRVLSMRSGVPLNQIRGRLEDEQLTAKRLIKAIDESKLPIWIDDRGEQTPSTITGVARHGARTQKIGLIVIDYLQLIRHEGNKTDGHHIKVGETSRRLKLLARTLGIPIVCLAQLNRECETRPDGRPQLSDFRESGNLEQDADVAMLLWPQKFPDGQPRPTQTITICVEKQRNGPRKEVPLIYRRAVTRFESQPIPM